MIAFYDRADEVDQYDYYAPHPARNRLCIAAEDLEGQRRGVGIGGIVCDRAEGEDNNADAIEAVVTG